MTRGNQRELDRLKNLKKNKGATKRDNPENLSVSNIKINDAEIMRKKQQAALEKKENESKK